MKDLSDSFENNIRLQIRLKTIFIFVLKMMIHKFDSHNI